jgi:hypothetical protein
VTRARECAARPASAAPVASANRRPVGTTATDSVQR